MKYKVGDKVRIKSIDWYNENKGNADKTNSVWCKEGGVWFFYHMSQYCGKIMTIENVWAYSYTLEGSDSRWTDEMIEGLVERNGKTYPYKIGDRVILKGSNRCATITDLKYNCQGNLSYYIKIDNDKDISIDYPTDLLLPYNNMIEGLGEDDVDLIPKFGEFSDNEPLDVPTMTTEFVKEHGLPCPDGYQFTDENGNVINATKIVLEKKKKKEYPKTYEECCEVLGIDSTINHTIGTHFRYRDTIKHFINLLICRDAYWKIAGDEMGLGKPYKF